MALGTVKPGDQYAQRLIKAANLYVKCARVYAVKQMKEKRQAEEMKVSS